jgi:hypothetical protein
MAGINVQSISHLFLVLAGHPSTKHFTSGILKDSGIKSNKNTFNFLNNSKNIKYGSDAFQLRGE